MTMQYTINNTSHTPDPTLFTVEALCIPSVDELTDMLEEQILFALDVIRKLEDSAIFDVSDSGLIIALI